MNWLLLLLKQKEKKTSIEKISNSKINQTNRHPLATASERERESAVQRKKSREQAGAKTVTAAAPAPESGNKREIERATDVLSASSIYLQLFTRVAVDAVAAAAVGACVSFLRHKKTHPERKRDHCSRPLSPWVCVCPRVRAYRYNNHIIDRSFSCKPPPALLQPPNTRLAEACNVVWPRIGAENERIH